MAYDGFGAGNDLTERRAGDGDIRERLVAVETKLEQLPLVRERVHALIQCTQQLVSGLEDQKDALKRVEQGQKELATKTVEASLAAAHSETKLATIMADHIEHCKTDKTEEKETLARLEKDRDYKHAENQAKINELKEWFMSTIKWVGTIVGSFIVLLFGIIGFLLANPQFLVHAK